MIISAKLYSQQSDSITYCEVPHEPRPRQNGGTGKICPPGRLGYLRTQTCRGAGCRTRTEQAQQCMAAFAERTYGKI